MRKIIAIAMIVLGLLTIAQPVLACNPTPYPTDCASLGSGYNYGFRVYVPQNKTYHLNWHDGKMLGGAPEDPNNTITLTNTTIHQFDFNSTIGIDAIVLIVDISNNEHDWVVKKFSEAKTGHMSITSSRSIDKAYFCYDYELSVSKTAEGTFDKAPTWEISKSVVPETQAKFAGETGKFDYTVAVHQTGGTGSGYKVASKVTVKNETPIAATIKSISDLIKPINKAVKLSCGVTFPYKLGIGKTLTCTGSVPLDTKLEGYNWAKVTTTGNVGGGTATADINWKENGAGSTITVTDTNPAFGGPYTVSSDQTWTYSATLPCPSDQAAYANGPVVVTLDNTATIKETGQSASKSVSLTCYNLDVTTSAKASAEGVTTWGITKTVDATEQAKFAGETAKFKYTVAVDKLTEGSGGYNVEATAVVANNTPLDATIQSITDLLKPGDAPVALDCGIAFPYTLPAGQSLTCTGKAHLDAKLDGGTNFVSVKASSEVTASSPIEWTSEVTPGASGYNTITVTDTNAAFGGPYTVTDDKSWDYSVDLACPTEQSAYANGPVTVKLDNTAAITETKQNASQGVSVVCYAPTLSPATNASYDVLYTWNIDKTTTTTGLTLQIGATDKAYYSVKTDVESTTTSNVKLAGAVTVSNPHPTADLTASLTDEIAPGVPATFTNCTNPLTIPANGSVTCNFELALDTMPSGANNASLAFNSLTWTATSNYDNAVKNEIDECVTVYDFRLANPLGTVCAPEAPAVYNYDLVIGPYATCGIYGYLNSAYFVTNDTEAEGNDNVTVPVTVECPLVTNCTKPEAYWLASSDPADTVNYDPTWDLIPNGGQAAPFYTTGLTWIDMFKTTTSGSAYNVLAHAYITAQLNILFGADPAVISANLSHADALLNQYAQTQSKVTGTVATDFNKTATSLTNWNRGLTGKPSKCPNCQY